MTPRSEAIDASMIRVHRAGFGPALVLLHCVGADHRLWDIAGKGLADDFTLLSYDFPGHGETPVPDRSYGIEDLSAQLLAVLDREGIERAHVIGLALGGFVALHFAASAPARVERLVAIDAVARGSEDTRHVWTKRAAAARARGVAALTPALLSVWFTEAFIAADPPALRYARDVLERTPGEGYALACEALAAVDLTDLVPKISAPTLVICGDGDAQPFREGARWLVANIRGARGAWLAASRHCSILEQPDAFRGVLRAFLRGAA